MANKVSLTLLAALPLVLRSSLGTAGQYQGTVVGNVGRVVEK